jgi:uncharacterized protein
MEISKFNIKSSLDDSDKVLLYNTLTTALIVLESKQYYKIFEDRDFTNTKIIHQLFKSGFIVESNSNEFVFLEKLRKKDLDNPIQDIGFLTTTKCNARCYYCFEKGIKQYDLTKETADKAISFLKKLCPDEQLRIFWFGGEPFLNFDIIKHVTFELQECGYKLNTNIITNGSLLTQDIIDFFKQHYQYISFQITIDGVFEHYYNVKKYVDLTSNNAFSIVINNIKRLLYNGLTVKIRINFKTSAIEEGKKIFSNIIKLLEGCDLSNLLIYLSPLSLDGIDEIMSNYNTESEHPFLQIIKTELKYGLSMDSTYRKNKDKALLNLFELNPKCSFCGASCARRVTINANGELYKCHRLVGRKEFCVGNVVDGFDETSEIYNYFRNPLINDDDCLNCSILPICHGGCKGNELLYGKRHKCHNIKQVRSELVRLYYRELLKYKQKT